MHMNISNIENTNVFVLPINKVYAEAKSMEARFRHSKKKKKTYFNFNFYFIFKNLIRFRKSELSMGKNSVAVISLHRTDVS